MFEMLASTAAAAETGFDVGTATRAYLDTLQGVARDKSDAYFMGGYWLILWGALVAVLIDWLILKFRIAASFRNLGEKWFKRRWMVTWLTALLYTVAGWAMTLPWSIYTEFYREKQYDLMDLSFGGWVGETLTSFVITLIILPFVIVAIYAVMRRAPSTWWLWGTGVMGIFLAFGMLVAPVFISPLFNEYTEMEAGPLRDKLVAMAGRYDVPAENIYVFDQSKQNKRISANVSGLGPTIRISLNDNLLERTSDEEVMAVMGHELGHYKLRHTLVMLGIIMLIIGIGLFLVSRIAPILIKKYGGPQDNGRVGDLHPETGGDDQASKAKVGWDIREMADPASLPLLGILLSVYFLAATPALNSLVRWAESDADAFGLEAAEEPDAFARAAMRLSEYRKIEPGPIEEFLFFDHPSGETRVRMSMEWKAKNVDNPQIVIPAEGYLDTE